MQSRSAIHVDGVSKRYLIGHESARGEGYRSLRESLGSGVRHLGRKTGDLLRGRQLLNGDEVEEFWALRDVSFEVKLGEVLGIIGRNGAGKSTLLKILSRITEPTTGRIQIDGRVVSLLEVGTGFHPELTGRENIFLNGAILGMTRREIRTKFDEIVAFAEVERFLDTPVKRYSSGMYVRLAFAVAAHLEPEILIVDEVLAVGDAEFQRKCLGKMQEVTRGHGRTILFVSHNMSAISDLCSRAVLLDRGSVVQQGSVRDVVDSYLASGTETGAVVDLTERAASDRPQRFFQLMKLELRNHLGRVGTHFEMGEPLIATIDVECIAPVKNAEVGLKISSQSDVTIHYFTSSWEGLKCDLKPGRYSFEVSVPKLMLYPGKYQIGVWAGRASEDSDTKAMNVTSIRVLKGDVTGYPTSIDKYAVSGCEVYAPSSWKMAQSS